MKHRLMLLRNATYSSVGTYSEYFIGLIISILIARHLGPTQYGVYTLLIWLSALGVMLVNGGLSTGAVKFLAEARGGADPAAAAGVFGFFYRLQLRSAAVFSLVFVACVAFVGDHLVPQGSPQLLWFVIVAVFFKSMYMFYVSAAKGFERFSVIAHAVFFVAPVNLATVAALYFFKADMNAFIWAYTGISVLYFLSMRRLLFKDMAVSGTVSDSDKKRIFHHLKVVTINVALGFIVFKQSEVVFLGYLSSPEDVAYYNIGFTLASAGALLLPGVFSAILLPLMARTMTENQDLLALRFRAATRYLLLLATPVVAIGTVFAEELIVYLYGEEYLPAVFVCQVLLFAAAFNALAHGAQSYHLSADRQSTVLALIGVAAVVNITLDYVLIKNYGLIGAVSASAISTSLMSFALIANASRLLRSTLEYWVYVRVALAGVTAVLPLIAIKYYIGGVGAALLGGAVFFTVFLPLTLAANCWSRQDIHMLRALGIKAGLGRLPGLRRFLI